MAPPQVNLNEKPPATLSQEQEANDAGGKKEALLSSLSDRYNDLANDPLPEKKDSVQAPVIVTVPGESHGRPQITAEQRRQRKRCRVACCISLSFVLVMLLALGTACLVYRMKHRKSWHSYCRVMKGPSVPESVSVNHADKLIYVKPDRHNNAVMEMLHEYNRRLIAFKNSTAKACYIDRLDETFAEGYDRWQGYEEQEHKQGRTLRVVPQKIQIDVVKHFAGVHIFEHCGSEQVEYFWVMEVTEAEIQMKPTDKYIVV